MLLGTLVLLQACKEKVPAQEEPEVEEPIEDVEKPKDDFVFDPAPFPGKNVTGIDFPTERTTIEKWVAENDQKSMLEHAWGIWAGLTANSKVRLNNQKLLVFETWLDVQQLGEGANSGKTYEEICAEPRNRNWLGKLEQLFHGNPEGEGEVEALGIETGNANRLESVKYDPYASEHAIKNSYLNLEYMEKLAASAPGDTLSIKDFPKPSITIKPTYYVFSSDDLEDNRYFKMHAWPGDYEERAMDEKGFGPTKWKRFVWVDTENKSKGTGKVSKEGDSTRTEDCTYNLKDFIHFTFSEEHASLVNEKDDDNIEDVSAGDWAILVGMHVTTKELKRWTWQTYWWEANPDKPLSPSTPLAAELRKKAKLSKEASHYAVAVAYSMLNPAQPIRGGENAGDTVIAFNPYLEAAFGCSVFGNNAPIASEVKLPDNSTVTTCRGIRTNCMSCHSMATVNFTTSDGKTTVGGQQYIGNRYISISDPAIFNDYLQIDFLWSINLTLGNVVSAEKTE